MNSDVVGPECWGQPGRRVSLLLTSWPLLSVALLGVGCWWDSLLLLLLLLNWLSALFFLPGVLFSPCCLCPAVLSGADQMQSSRNNQAPGSPACPQITQGPRWSGINEGCCRQSPQQRVSDIQQ